jgi:DNA repair exonuclease SbcCD nuclease subunit
MFRFVHAADLHLDSPLLGLDFADEHVRAEVRLAPRRALENLVRLCLDERVDFLLLAGDVYDGDWKDFQTGQYFVRQMRELGNIPVFMVRGNHDAQSVITKHLTLPPNVTALPDDEPATFPVAGKPVVIHGRGFKSRETRENLVRHYPDSIPGCFNIGLLHTCLTGSGSHPTYAPCTPDQLSAKGYQYWALGHVHNRQVVREHDPVIVFPGNVQGRHARETGPKGCYLVEVEDGGGVELAFRELDVVRWELVECDAGGELEPEAIFGRLAAAARPAGRAAGDRLLVLRAVVRGETQAHAELQANRRAQAENCLAVLQNVLGNRAWLESVRFDTRPPSDDLAGADLEDAIAAVAGIVDELSRSPEDLAARLQIDELQRLDDRLPTELKRGDEALSPTDPVWAARQLARVLPILQDAGRVRGAQP